MSDYVGRHRMPDDTDTLRFKISHGIRDIFTAPDYKPVYGNEHLFTHPEDPMSGQGRGRSETKRSGRASSRSSPVSRTRWLPCSAIS